MARMADKLLVESDEKRVREYVKKVLFPKTIFVFNQKALDADDRLHNDFMANCKSLIGDGILMGAAEEDARSYMTMLWNKMKESGSYKKWMQMKRSNNSQAMADSFKRKCMPKTWSDDVDMQCLSTRPFACLLLACFPTTTSTCLI
jgi:hypothetical protein